MKLNTEEILEKIEELKYYKEIAEFIFSLDLTPKQMELLSDHENKWVRNGLAQNTNLTEKVMIKLSSDKNKHVRYWLTDHLNLTEKVMILLSSDEDIWVSRDIAKQLENLNSLKSEDLESAYDLINNSKHISRENFEKTFDYIINKFPELSKLAKMFKRIILKGKKDLK